MLGKALLSASVSASPGAYVEDVFSTYLYTGNGSTQTITNGIDLAGEGGATWLKVRDLAGEEPTLFSTDTTYGIGTNTTGFNTRLNSSFWTTTSSGFNLLNSNPVINQNLKKYVSWTFRKAPKFFDVVTYTGTGADQTISHNLGSTPGCIIVKQTSGAGEWYVYHRSLSAPSQNWIRLANTAAANGDVGQDLWGPPTSTTFKADTYLGHSTSGATYVAYLFAHDAGGFGDSEDESVIKCGSYTGNVSTTGPVIDLGWEPQWVMIKRATGGIGNWSMFDTMRGITVGGVDAHVYANTAASEETATALSITSQGFQINGSSTYINGSGDTYIYVAIRRGPMKTPTDATTVFKAFAGYDFINAAPGFPVDMYITRYTPGIYNPNGIVGDRLRGAAQTLFTTSTAAETAQNNTATTFQSNTQFSMNYAGDLAGEYLFRRAPGFFDVVCYTCNDQTAPITSNHNLGVVPEMMIVKKRAATGDWPVYHVSQGNTKYTRLNNGAIGFNTGSGYWNNTSPTATQFTVGTDGDVNSGTGGAVAYLFATCPGVSKVGSYTGTGTTQQINCGFTAGARFVLIKRSDSAGDWYVWDTARGIISGNDPYLLLSSTAAEVTSTDYIDPLSSGFEISSTAPAAINASGGTYIFLAIA
jgi:hypothetical protein